MHYYEAPDCLEVWINNKTAVIAGVCVREGYSPRTSWQSIAVPDAAGTATLSRARAPISGRTHSRAPCPSKRKENSNRGSRRLLRGRLRYRTGRLAVPISASPDSGIWNRLPFDRPGATETIAPCFGTAFANLLGPTDPCSTAVHMEPFSTSAFKVLVWIFATTTKIPRWS